MRIKRRNRSPANSTTRASVKRQSLGKTIPKLRQSRDKSDPNKVALNKIGPLCPVWGARTKAGSQIKSWRAWVHWVDGDWTCETMKSFNADQARVIEQRIKKGTDIWPWPETSSPKDNYRRNELKRGNMHKWQDPSSGSQWISIPQNERQDDDDEKDIPNEKDSLFVIQADKENESTTETADSDDSSEDGDEEEEDEI